MIHYFNEKQVPEISEVGGKAKALIETTIAGFNVPEGFVLSTDFFTNWISEIKATEEWEKFLASPNRKTCEKLKEATKQQKFSSSQKELLENALENVPAGMYAARSSSPQEDLENISFAGLYETFLGVTREGIEDAVRNVFLSMLDFRVVEYKKLNSIPLDNPRIAVIVQKQIAPEVSGVAFSLNPVNNSYDEAVINANFGLGETVVDGRVVPDTYVVDKVKKTILEKQTGTKQFGVWLADHGGTVEKETAAPEELALSDNQIQEVAELAAACEDCYGSPQDIEWTYEGGKLYLLQSRPVTGYIKLPQEFITKPGEKKILYQDGLLTEQGLVESLSPLGEGILKILMVESMKAFGPDEEATKPFVLAGGGRLYANLSNSIKLTGRKLIAKSIKSVDSLGAQIIDGMDLKPYVPKRLPRGIIRFMMKTAIGGIKSALISRKAYKNCDGFLSYFLSENRKLSESMTEEFEKTRSLDQLCATLFGKLGYWLAFISLPTLMASLTAKSKIKKMFGEDADPDKLILLERAFPHNVTIEMSEYLYKLSQFSEIEELSNKDLFLKQLNREEFSPEFLITWRHFIINYGFRCPREMDIATPRYHENPGDLFDLLKSMQYSRDSKQTPEILFAKGAEAREKTFEYFLTKCSSGKQKKLFRKRYKVLESYTAYREIHKYYTVMAMDFIRRRILKVAEDWVRSGRIDKRDDIFQLKYEEVLEGLENPQLELKSLISINSEYYGQFSRIENPPSIIDSRGYIPSLSREITDENELEGTPASPGLATGSVKVLKNPNEKLVMPGDILVAEATDPGWTPLFINAEGIVIQNGGVLQHGASVARESCKPCIVGVHNVTNILHDGQLVEMDGSSGVVRILKN